MDTTLPKGYKQTKIGVIPEEWEVVRLKDVLSKQIQNGYSPNCPENYTGHWILGLGSLSKDGKLNLFDRKPAPLNNEKVKKFILEKNDFLISRANTPERVGFSGVFRSNKQIYSYPDLMMRFRVSEKKVNIDFMENYLKSFRVLQYLQSSAAGSSSSMVKINKKVVENISLILPPLKEQQKIAEILTTWDKAISKQKELIKEKEKLKKGLMQRLLSAEVRFKEFTDEWEELALKDVLKERKTYLKKGLELEHVSLTTEGVVPKSERYERDFLVKDDNKKYKITKLNDICYNPANLKFGVICRNTYGDGIFSPIYVTFEVKKDFNLVFISYLLTWNTLIQKIRKYEQGTVYERMAVSPKDFLSFKIKLPSLREQQKIAEVLSTADKETELLKKELEELKKQKKGLIQRLLSGKVRVRYD